MNQHAHFARFARSVASFTRAAAASFFPFASFDRLSAAALLFSEADLASIATWIAPLLRRRLLGASRAATSFHRWRIFPTQFSPRLVFHLRTSRRLPLPHRLDSLIPIAGRLLCGLGEFGGKFIRLLRSSLGEPTASGCSGT